MDKSSSIDPSVQAVRTFASTDSERGYPRVQWISGGGCVLVISFLTCPLLLQLFETDVLSFETRSVFFDQTGQKSKVFRNWLKKKKNLPKKQDCFVRKKIDLSYLARTGSSMHLSEDDK